MGVILNNVVYVLNDALPDDVTRDPLFSDPEHTFYHATTMSAVLQMPTESGWQILGSKTPQDIETHPRLREILRKYKFTQPLFYVMNTPAGTSAYPGHLWSKNTRLGEKLTRDDTPPLRAYLKIHVNKDKSVWKGGSGILRQTAFIPNDCYVLGVTIGSTEVGAPPEDGAPPLRPPFDGGRLE